MTNADKLRASAPDDAKLARELADRYGLRLDHDYQLRLAHFTNVSEDDLREIVRLLRAWPEPICDCSEEVLALVKTLRDDYADALDIVDIYAPQAADLIERLAAQLKTEQEDGVMAALHISDLERELAAAREYVRQRSVSSTQLQAGRDQWVTDKDVCRSVESKCMRIWQAMWDAARRGDRTDK